MLIYPAGVMDERAGANAFTYIALYPLLPVARFCGIAMVAEWEICMASVLNACGMCAERYSL